MDTQELINSIVDNAIDGNNVAAKDAFDNAMAQKMTDAFETRKVELAQSIYSREQTDEPEEADSSAS